MQYARVALKALILVFVATMSSAAQTAPAPDQPDAMDLLKSVELTYGAMNTYSAKVTSTMAMGGPGTQSKVNVETPMTVTADATGKFRTETTGMMGMTIVYDGSAMWMYMAGANSYSKFPLDGAAPSAEAGATSGGKFGSGSLLDKYKNIAKGVKEAKILRSEKVHVNGADVDCWVVSLENETPGAEASAAAEAAGVALSDLARSETLWVDKSRYLVYRVDTTAKMTMPNASTPTAMNQTTKVESFTVNDPVSPDVFTFTPPPGAKEIDESQLMKAKTPPKQQSQP